MLLNVRDLVHRPGEMRELQQEYVLAEPWGEGLAAVAAGSTIAVNGRAESVHEGILLTGDAATEFDAECGRCLQHFTETLQVDFTELFAYNPTEADEYGVHGDHVNLEPPLRDAIVLALPFQPVCRADCFGLDPDSGERLTSEAAAEATPAVDPRWAALAGFSVDNDKSGAEH
ncbi:DUF177 domain-containing protein [Leucobacter sp. OH1287]|uniref:YceD family protein n=1 Tax=Leucobacter sp. OH1287 TaxID=2491049 RepID=UPI000F5D690F|nr:DUF177 domain-containing protein [Leucobacter sp. OH1287]RRD60491.1 DUF177 domain-containing protein [Leucobacter sp. OH1287]